MKTKDKIVFTGNFWEYFIFSLGLLVLCVVTLGILLPYFFIGITNISFQN